jgi:hypothetical protein
MTITTYQPDNGMLGCEYLHKAVVLASGQNLTRLAVLGKTVTAGTIAGAAVTGNTGNGTIGSLTVSGTAKEGIYRAVCKKTATNGGEFLVINPFGRFIGTAYVGVAFSNEINFIIADGGTDFALNDAFTITTSVLTEKYKLSSATATDGSQYPDCILVEDTDATTGDISTVAYTEGEFDKNSVTIGAGHTLSSVTEQLRLLDIHLINTII